MVFLLSACDTDKPNVSAKDHIDLAHLYFKQGSFRASIIESKNALQIEPNNIEALTTMATTLLKLGEEKGAINLLKKAIKIENDNQNIQLLLSQSYLSQGKISLAEETLEGINPRNIENISTYQIASADIQFATNQFKKAKIWYLKAFESDSKNIKAILGLAKMSLLLKQNDDTYKYTKLALETSPSNIDALIWQAQIHLRQKKYIDAENILSRAMNELEKYDTLTANKYIAIEMLAKTLLAQGKIQESFTYSNFLAQSRPGQLKASYENALSLISKENSDISKAELAFQDVLKQAPEHKPTGIILGLINYQKGDYTQAEDYLSKFANDENTPLRSKKILALTKIKLGKLDNAIEFISGHIKHNKNDADLYALLGHAHTKKREFDKSISALKKAIELSDKNSIYYVNLAKAYLASKNSTSAKKSAKKALTIKPNSEPAKLILVSSYIFSKEFKKARNLINNWLQESPKSIVALNTSASFYQELKQSGKARTQFLKVLTIDPYNLVANLNLVRFDLNEKKFDKAFDRLSLIINRTPENLPALSMLFKLAIRLNSTDQAIQILNTTIKQHPSAIKSHLILAQLYLFKKQTNKSLETINTVVKIDKNNVDAYLLKAKVFLSQNKTNKAKDTYQLLSSLFPDNPLSYIELGKMSLKEKNHNRAVQYAKKALSIKDNYIPAYIILYNAGIVTDNTNMILNSISAIKLNAPNSHVAYEMEADFHLKLKDFKKAIGSLQQAWGKHKNIKLATKLQYAHMQIKQDNLAFKAWDELASKNQSNLKLHINYSLALQKANQTIKAKKMLENQLRSHPKNAILLNNLANIYLEIDDIRALETAKKALLYNPKNPAIQDTVGWIYLEQHKDYEKSIPLLEQAYKTTGDKQIKEHLVKALKEAGETTKAMQLIDK